MDKPSPGGLLAFLIGFLGVMAALLLGKGVLLLDQHEGDALHVLDILFRMEQGQWPHVDFMTPLGVLSFAPIVGLMTLGLGTGHAIIGGFLMFAALLLPAIWWAGVSRLSGPLAYAFGAMTLLICTTLVYGGTTQVTSISMYYNRWAWAVGFVLVVLAVLPARREQQWADGVIFGFGLAFLALSKVTFFVAFFPGILLALALRRQWMTLLVGLVCGLLVIGLVTLLGGVEFWLAYIGDLRAISQGPIRSAPGDSISVLLTGPTFLGANLCLIAAVVLLRQGGQAVEGIALLAFAPAFFYVTYQNWGNDPKWLILLSVILLSARPARSVTNGLGWDVGRAMAAVALVSFALILPSIVTMTLAPLRHARLTEAAFTQILPGARNADLKMKSDRVFAPSKRVGFLLNDAVIAKYSAEKPPERVLDQLAGQPLAACKLEMGMVGVAQQMAFELDGYEGLAGKSVFVADTFSNLWLFGATASIHRGAPWYYGGKTGLASADYVLVPLCPVTYLARSAALKEINAAPGLPLQEIARTDLYVLLKRISD